MSADALVCLVHHAISATVLSDAWMILVVLCGGVIIEHERSCERIPASARTTWLLYALVVVSAIRVVVAYASQ